MGTSCSKNSHELHEAEPGIVSISSKMSPGERVKRQRTNEMSENPSLQDVQSYRIARDALIAEERSQAFDAHAQRAATSLEKEAARIVRAIKVDDTVKVYGVAHGSPFAVADHFIGSVGLINRTELIKVARRLPKGGHLHCHYNSCLPPRFLIEHARNLEMMWIKSTTSLSTEDGKRNAEIQFQVQEHPSRLVPAQIEGDLMAEDYVPGMWMNYQKFQERFGGTAAAEEWLESKMLLTEDEVHGVKQNVKE